MSSSHWLAQIVIASHWLAQIVISFSLVVNIFMLYTEEGSDYSHIHLRPVVELTVIIKLTSLAGTNCDIF
jgi:hypothetical protein